MFTSGGTESDNLAVIGAALAARKKGNHIITTSFEHHAVLDACKHLEKLGFQITYLPFTADGLGRVEEVAAAVKENTVLISMMHVNNEVGTIQPVEEIGRLAKSRQVLFHTDAVQSVGRVPVTCKRCRRTAQLYRH